MHARASEFRPNESTGNKSKPSSCRKMRRACRPSKHLGLPFIRALLYYPSCVHPSHRGYKSLTNRFRVGSSRNLVLGVDIGGTKVAVGVVNSRGQIRHAARTSMAARGTAEEGFRAVLRAMDGV